MAAWQAARLGAEVALYERNPVCGKKLSVTGSGHCNISNAAVAAEKYACGQPAWLQQVFQGYGTEDLLADLESIGLPCYATHDGWYYPLSNSAQAFSLGLTAAVEQAGVKLFTGTDVQAIEWTAEGFQLKLNKGENSPVYQKVILASGGAAYPQLGAGTELLQNLQSWGHTVQPMRPALAPLEVELGKFKPLSGQRFDLRASIWQGAKELLAAEGNAIFTDWGLNGPPIMDISHIVSLYPEKNLTLRLDLLAGMKSVFVQQKAKLAGSPMSLLTFLSGFYAPKISRVLLGAIGFDGNLSLNSLSQADWQKLLSGLQQVDLRIIRPRGFEVCHASAGGVNLLDVDAPTMQSKKIPGLYLAGELLDVSGPCGGYNLQFAFSSGALAGRAAASF